MAGPVLALAMVELFAFSRNSPEAYPTLSLLADPVLAGYLARGARILPVVDRILGVGAPMSRTSSSSAYSPSQRCRFVVVGLVSHRGLKVPKFGELTAFVM